MRKGYEVLIIITYFVMLAVCVFLNLTSGMQAGGLANIIVNAALFVITGAVFFVSITGSLKPVAGITADLIRVSSKIEEDAKHSHKYLWEKYREENTELFRDRILAKQYKDYGYELERIVHNDKAYYKCDIEEYIGYDLVDAVIHRESLNQVAGVMTGLGILGTFIGLTLGLQAFNTGTTAEITNSIEPLMNGIKVAFHTSIFGMIFSLVFNYVYKRRLDEGENAVREFLAVYKKYVMPDTSAEGVNRMMELQQKQTDAILLLSDYADIRARNQIEQLSKLIDVFITELNKSLGNSFTNLSDTINKTMAVQAKNEKQMQEIFESNVGAAQNMESILNETRALDSSLKTYVAEVQLLEKAVAGEIRDLKSVSAENRELIESIPRETGETFKIINENLQMVSRSYSERLDELSEAIGKMDKKLKQ